MSQRGSVVCRGAELTQMNTSADLYKQIFCKVCSQPLKSLYDNSCVAFSSNNDAGVLILFFRGALSSSHLFTVSF